MKYRFGVDISALLLMCYKGTISLNTTQTKARLIIFIYIYGSRVSRVNGKKTLQKKGKQQ